MKEKMKVLRNAFEEQNLCEDCKKSSSRRGYVKYALPIVFLLLLIPVVFGEQIGNFSTLLRNEWEDFLAIPMIIAALVFFFWIFKRKLFPVIVNNLKAEWIYTDVRLGKLNPFPLVVIILILISIVPPLLYTSGVPMPDLINIMPSAVRGLLNKIYIFNSNDLFLFITWIVWWPLFLVTIFIFRRIWCGGFCPFGLTTDFGNWVGKKLRLNNPAKTINVTKWVFMGFITFATIGYLHDALNITNSLIMTVEFLLFFFLFAFVIGMILPRRSFCRLFCFLGTLPHLFGRLATLGLKTEQEKCVKCEGKWCIAGEHAEPQKKYNELMPKKRTGLLNMSGCPMYINVPNLGHTESNRHCILCGNCIKLCPYDAIHYQFLTPGYELLKGIDLNFQEVFFMFGILGILAMFITFEAGFLANWANFLGIIEHPFITGSYALLMVGIIITAYSLVSLITGKITGTDFRSVLKTAGYAYLPLTYMAFLRDVIITYAINGSAISLAIPQLAKEMIDIGMILIGVAWSIYMAYRMMPLISQKSKLSGSLPHMILILALGAYWLFMQSTIYHGFGLSFLLSLVAVLGTVAIWRLV